MTEKNLAEVWQTLAHKILSSVLVDHGAVIPVMDVLSKEWRLFPPKDAAIWKAVCECVEHDTLPTIEAVSVRVNGKSEPGYIKTIAAMWNEDDNRRVVYHAEQLKSLGMLQRIRQIGRELSTVDDPDKLTKAIDETETQLAGVLALQTNRKGDATSVSESAWLEVENFDKDEILTGLKWFDNLTGGVWTGFNYWVAGAYKSGKSTLMRNLVLNIAQAKVPVDVFVAEGSREMFALDCQAMIATGLLLKQGFNINKLALSGLWIKRAWRKQYRLQKEIIDTIRVAREIFEQLPIQVWDSRDGIRNHATLRHRVKQSKFDFGSKVFFGDYSQLFGSDGTLFERQMATAHLVQDIATTENIAFWMLTQRNEESIRSGGGYSAGVKGGGDASAAADFMLIPSIDSDNPIDFKLKLKHSRHTATGEHTHLIEPSSGLIIDKWIKANVSDSQQPHPLAAERSEQ